MVLGLSYDKIAKTEKNGDIVISENVSGNVPKTGLEPAYPLRYKNLNLVCLPISPPGPLRRDIILLLKAVSIKALHKQGGRRIPVHGCQKSPEQSIPREPLYLYATEFLSWLDLV